MKIKMWVKVRFSKGLLQIGWWRWDPIGQSLRFLYPPPASFPQKSQHNDSYLSEWVSSGIIDVIINSLINCKIILMYTFFITKIIFK